MTLYEGSVIFDSRLDTCPSSINDLIRERECSTKQSLRNLSIRLPANSKSTVALITLMLEFDLDLRDADLLKSLIKNFILIENNI